MVRTNRDPRMNGKYIFADLAGPVFLAEENAGKWSKTLVNGLECAPDSPVSCTPKRGAILSFGEMRLGDIVFGDDKGSVFRFVEPARCAGR